MAKKPNLPKNKEHPTIVSQEALEHRGMIIIHAVNAFGSVMKTLIICGCVVLVVYFGVYKPIEASAGQETTITYLATVAADVKMHVWMAWGLAGGCGVWGYAERKKRLSERKERDDRIKKLEQTIDPGRSSSGLTVEGKIDRGPKQ